MQCLYTILRGENWREQTCHIYHHTRFCDTFCSGGVTIQLQYSTQEEKCKNSKRLGLKHYLSRASHVAWPWVNSGRVQLIKQLTVNDESGKTPRSNLMKEWKGMAGGRHWDCLGFSRHFWYTHAAAEQQFSMTINSLVWSQFLPED